MKLNPAFAFGISAIALLSAQPVLAQDATPSESATETDGSVVGDIVITGTNIRGVAPVGSTVIALTAADLTAAGAVSTAQMLQQVPQILNVGVSESSRGQSGGSTNTTFASSINLRGIGAYSTLTLANGHRVVPQGTSGAAVDPSSIPASMIQRIDIVADGASAVFGSDAIAGVVNLIMRRNFEGVEATARYGLGDAYSERTLSLTAGRRWSTGQLTIGFEHGYRSGLGGQDRDFYGSDLRSRGGGDYRDTACNPGTLTVNGTTYAIPVGGVTPATAQLLVPGTVNRCDNAKYADLLPRQKHNSLAFTFDQEVGSRVSLFADGFYTNRTFSFTPRASTATLTVPSSSPNFVLPTGVVASSATINYSFAGLLPENELTGGSRAWNVAYGAKVDLGSGFRLTLSGTYGDSQDYSYSSAGLDTRTVALGGAINTAIANGSFNPFAANPGSVANFATQILDGPGGAVLQTYGAKIDGALFSLPGGAVRAAVGYEHQNLSSRNGTFQGFADANGTYTIPYRDFQRSVHSGYAEIQIPIVGAGNSNSFIRSLEVNLAGRFDRYEDIGASTTNPKIGVNWEVVSGLRLRGSYGTSFRAPVFSQVYGSSSRLIVQNYQDPNCNCTIKGVVQTGPNLDLKPETATTWSVGADFSPAALPGFRASVGYFSIDYRNQINSVTSDTSILSREAQFAGTNIVQRAGDPVAFANFLASRQCLGQPDGVTTCTISGGTTTGALVYVDGRSQNLGVTKAGGIDFDVNYRTGLGNGTLRLGLAGTYFTNYKVAVTPLSPLIDQRNTIFNPFTLRARGSARYTLGDLEVGVVGNFMNAYTNTVPTIDQRVPAYVSTDLHLGYTFRSANGRDLKLSLDVANLMDTDPPFVDLAPQTILGGGGYDPSAVSPIGRIVSISASVKF